MGADAAAALLRQLGHQWLTIAIVAIYLIGRSGLLQHLWRVRHEAAEVASSERKQLSEDEQALRDDQLRLITQLAAAHDICERRLGAHRAEIDRLRRNEALLFDYVGQLRERLRGAGIEVPAPLALVPSPTTLDVA